MGLSQKDEGKIPIRGPLQLAIHVVHAEEQKEINIVCLLFGKHLIRNGPLEKLWGEWGIFEPQEFFSLSNSMYEFFKGRSMNIF